MSVRRLAFLGFGHVAEHGHLPAWRQRDDFQIVAATDIDPQRRARARRLLPTARVYEDSVELLAREELDLVDIATPPALHSVMATQAAATGCHILCEKPIATSAADYQTTLRAVRSANVTLFTVHNWKHSEQFTQLAALLAEGAIGHPLDIRFEIVRAGQAVTVGQPWRQDAGVAGGGILVDHGWHAIYLLLGLARQRPGWIRATLERRRYTTASVEDTATCEIEFPSLTSRLYFTWAGTERRTRWSVRGSEGTVTVEDDWAELRRDSALDRFAFTRSLSASSHHPDWFSAVIDDFVGAIDDSARRDQNLSEAESCLLLTDLAYMSGSNGGRPLAVPARFPS